MLCISRLFPRREVINGCTNPAPLLSRWKLLCTPYFNVFLHCFHRSDEDREMHSHPWFFISIILWRGYVEARARPDLRRQLRAGNKTLCFNAPETIERKRFFPGAILFRPAWWAHRVELVDGRPSWSLVITSRKACKWGFFTADGWIHDKEFHLARGCE